MESIAYFTECFQGKVKVTKERIIINAVGNFFSREITFSDTHYFQPLVFFYFTGYIMFCDDNFTPLVPFDISIFLTRKENCFII